MITLVSSVFIAATLFVPRTHNGAQVAGFALALGAGRPAALAGHAVLRVLKRILRDRGVELPTRISGRLLSVIAVQLVAGSVRAFAEQG